MNLNIKGDFQICISVPLRKQNPLYISKIKFRNGQEDHVLVVSALELSTFKKCTYVKKFFSVDTMYVISTYK